MVRAIIAVVLLAVSTSALAEACDPNETPLPTQQPEETSTAADPILQEPCLEITNALVELGPSLGSEISEPTFSDSPTWGKVARIDVKKQNPGRHMRVVCFKSFGDMGVRMAIYDQAKDTCSRFSGWTIYPPGAVPRK